ncbi:fatty-acid amide hydrolase 2-like isoform X1 [Arctopsyche grandis]|uniref:fatty-acid amide hydrolase 2-like isoform X1 n=1 Tax=Arctopsyche grandis TaxID=121162 RepID=UPI00406D9BB7
MLVLIMHIIGRKFLRSLLWILGLFVNPIIYLLNCRGKKTVPPITNPLLTISAAELAKRIRERKLKSEDVIKAYIERCKEVNPIINAVVEPRYDIALTEAKNIDQMIASGTHSIEQLEKIYPLLGIPITVKESIAVAGMSNEAGRFRSKRIPAVKDADCIAQVRAAGAIPLLVSNTPELCMCWETFNYVTGTTKNPYDTRKTVGGSSGGEAALISSGASLIGIGSDIAGSLRLPAMYTGIFGHKPTPYAVSTDGHKPYCTYEEWNEVFILGPMTRYAEDLPLILNVLKNPKGPNLQLEKKVPIEEIKFFFMEGDGSGATNEINSDMYDAIHRVIRYLENKQIKVQKANLKKLKYCFEVSVLNLLRLEGVETIFSKPGNPSEWRSVSKEFFKKIFGLSKSTFTCIAYGFLKKLSRLIPKSDYEKAIKINQELKTEFMDLLQDNGVCLYPTFIKNAPFHYDYISHLMDFTYLFMFNSLGLPATNCPVGIAMNGLPIGIQVVASPGCDHLLFSVAKELENAFGGWIPPS